MMTGAVLSLFVWIGVPAGDYSLQKELDAEIAAIHAEYHVKVHYAYSAEKFFPKMWLKAPFAGEGKAIPYDEAKRLLPIVRTMLSKHPKEILRKDLKDIFLLSEMKFYGKPFGGTNSRDGVYIVSQGLAMGYTDEHLEAIGHAEFSSILFRKYDFPEDEWNAVNPTDFRYGKSGVDFLDQANLYGQNRNLLSDGFLVKYSQSTLEDDFNTLSGWLFTSREKLKVLNEQYPKLKAKHDLTVQFYKSLSAKYDVN